METYKLTKHTPFIYLNYKCIVSLNTKALLLI